MAYHAVLEVNMIQAKDIDAMNRNAVSESAVDNGNLVVLTTRSAAADEGEVFTAVVPSTANGLTGLWMVYQPDEVVLTDGKYKGLNPDPRDFYTPAGDVFSVFKPQIGDIVTLTAEGLAGSKSTNTYANATDTTGGLKPVWGATQTASVFSLHLLATKYISLATGSLGETQRITAYEFEVVGL